MLRQQDGDKKKLKKENVSPAAIILGYFYAMWYYTEIVRSFGLKVLRKISISGS
jgi:hypothetical protein